MRRLGFDDLAGITADLAPHLGDAWPPPADVVRRLGAELAPLSTHAVVRIDVDGEPCALKLFRSWARGEPDREWAMLTLLDGTGWAPHPVWWSANDPPAIVTSWVDGEGLRADALTSADMAAIGDAHEAIHALSAHGDLPVAISAGHVTRQRVVDWWHELPEFAATLGLDERVTQRLAEPPFASSDSVADALTASPLVACRGDTHIKNYVRHRGALSLLDFEDAGLAEPVFELADMIEHFGNRSVDEDRWREVIAVVRPDADLLAVARGLHAEFWFALTIRRQARGLAMSPPIAPGEQLRRLEQLGAYA